MAHGSRWQRNVYCVLIGVFVFTPLVTCAQDVSEQVRKVMESMTGGPPPQPSPDQQEEQPVESESAADTDDRSTGLVESEVEISPTGTVTLNFVDLPLSTALRMLSLETNRNIIATPAVEGTVTASLHSVTFEEALDAILLSNRAAYRAEGRFIYVYTQEELAEIIAAENPPESRVFRLSYVQAKDIEPAITPLLSNVGKLAISEEAEDGIASGSDDAGGASLATTDYIVVHDRPLNLDAIEAVIEKLDIRPQQVLVEATILSAELNDEML